MKYLYKIMMIAVAMVTAIPSFAVTDKEMEQARAVAAKHYLRYANNGSDYLDKLNPSSVAELSKSLKAKEKENIKSFNEVAVPKDYASWDKKKLVEYWSSTFFKSPGLKDDGKKCLGILAKKLNNINVGSPAPKEETPAEPEKKAEAPAAPAQAPASAEPVATTSAAQEEVASPEAIESEIAAAQAQAEADAGLTEERPEKSSGTGWYIAILVLLVGVVIWLVMYASKSMKATEMGASGNGAGEKEIRELKRAAKEEQNKMREQYATSLTSKNDEIKQLRARCEELEGSLEAAMRERDAARREVEAARGELARERSRRQEVSARESAPQRALRQEQPVAAQRRVSEQQAPVPAKPTAQKSAPSGGGLPPVVYLGHVNQRGFFVKASRSLQVDSSVFYMDIPDGHHGKFRVANAPEIMDRLLSDPKLWLEGGCDIVNPEDADIATEIVTLDTGEVLFADNTCRVVKKARIKFI